MFCSVLLSGSVKTILRLKRSFGVILAIFGRFCKTEKARIGAISWADIVSVWPPLSIFKKVARWHPVQKRYSSFKFYDNIATYKVQKCSRWWDWTVTYCRQSWLRYVSVSRVEIFCSIGVRLILISNQNQSIQRAGKALRQGFAIK